MSRRRALLFGVPDYLNAAEFSSLPVVKQDVAKLQDVLAEAGYHVACESGDNPLALTRNTLEAELADAVRHAEDGEVLLLYFSGHGLNHDGRDYLVPIDISLKNPNRLKEFLIPVQLDGAVQNSRARMVLFVIDACREGVNWEWKASGVGLGSGDGAEQEGPTHFVTLFSCAPEEYSRFDHELSHFTRALIDALKPSSQAATLGEVIEYAQQCLDQITKNANAPRQTIHYRVEQRVDGDDPLDLVICTGERSLLDGAAESPWVRAVEQTILWDLVASGQFIERRKRPLKKFVLELVTRSWLEWERAKRELPEDPWSDEELAPRSIKRLEQLLCPSGKLLFELADLEIALLIAAPFLRDAVWASVVAKAAREAKPLDLELQADPTPLRAVLERRYDAAPQWRRKLQRLLELGRKSDHAAVACWQLYRLIQREPEVWQSECEGGWLPDELASLWGLKENENSEIGEAFIASRLFELARAVAASGEWLGQRHRHGDLSATVPVGDGAALLEIHEQLLAWLLTFSGHLALDVRRMPMVIADHVGLGDPLQPAAVIAHLRSARWSPKGDGLSLNLANCDHPALDFALEQYIHGVDELRHQIAITIADGGPLADLNSLPKHFQNDDVAIAKQDGRAAFSRPHLSFELDRDQILQLLMGEQLYGDPSLAIRELYQNALDACRYRQARERYLRLPGMPKQGKQEWQGRIDFEQGVDQHGRPYIECRENGIGMGMTELKECFTRAGRRFADTPEYLEERARWQRHGIEHYPNSQFGVGVLSYFMLADELEVETCRLSPVGNPDERLLATISGSGSLFRVKPSGVGADSGTRVRLYLNRDIKRPMVETLRQLLWVAEFPTVAVSGADKQSWQPGILDRKDTYSTGHPDIWWTRPDWSNRYSKKNGAFLADGVAVAGKRGSISTSARHSFLIVNLHGPRRPKLSVDRSEIISTDKKWPEAVLTGEESFWRSLLDIPSLSFRWVASVAAGSVALGKLIVPELIIQERTLASGIQSNEACSIEITNIGLCEIDDELFSLIDGRYYDEKDYRHEIESIGRQLVGHRFAQYSKYGIDIPKKFEHLVRTREQTNLPALLPGDPPLLKLLLENSLRDRLHDEEWFWIKGVSAFQLMALAWVTKRTLGETACRIHELAPSVRLPELSTELDQHRMTTAESTLLSSWGSAHVDSWVSDNPPLSRWIQKAYNLEVTPHELIEQAAILSELGVGLDIPGELLDQTVTLIDTNLVKGASTKVFMVFEEKSGAWNALATLSEKASQPLEKVRSIIRQVHKLLAPYGVVPLADSELAAVLDIPSELLIQVDALINGDLGKGSRVRVFQFATQKEKAWVPLAQLSKKLSKPLAKVCSTIQHICELMAPYGFELIAETGAIPEDFVSSEDDLVVLSPQNTDVILIKHLAQAADKLNTTPAALVKRLQPYTAFGLKLPTIEEKIEPNSG